MRITLIHNPKSGYTSLSREELIDPLRDAGHDVSYWSSKEEEHLKQAMNEDADLIVIAGGDGAAGRIAKEFAPRHIPITIIPAGTANNIATALGIHGTPRDLIPRWQHWEHRRVSLGIAKGRWGEIPFLESFGLGLFALAMRNIEPHHDPAEQKFATREEEMEHAFREMKKLLERTGAREYAIDIDGVDHSGKYLLVEAMNLCLIGPNLLLAPEVDVGDEVLDVVFISEDEGPHFDEYLSRRINGEHLAPDLPIIHGRQVTIDPKGAPIHIDDELHSESHKPLEPPGPIELCVKPKELTFLAPQDMRNA